MSKKPIAACSAPVYQRIFRLVSEIPTGTVATYGQIAALAGKCTARMVGYAMASLYADEQVPWHRVVNAQGKISLRADSGGADLQRRLLQGEGLHFDDQGRINLRCSRWPGPDIAWLIDNGFDPTLTYRER
jgi:methylated-DNA-protein-cysteine methyltransferase related protein